MTESLLEVETVFSYKFAEGSYGVEGFTLYFESWNKVVRFWAWFMKFLTHQKDAS